MSHNQIRAAILGVVVIGAALIAIVVSRGTGGTQLVNTYDLSPSVFTFRYPAGWQYRVILQNLLILAQPATLNGTPGPTLTIQRSFPLTAQRSLSAALDTYLQEGPLRADRDWTMIGEITPTTFDGREALMVDLQGRESPENPQLRTHVVVTKANNGYVYVLAATAPLTEWEEHHPILDAILGSVDIVE